MVEKLVDTGSPLPFGVHRVPDQMTKMMTIGTACCLHCLSAFTAFPTANPADRFTTASGCLHCLSAFTAFPTADKLEVYRSTTQSVSIAFRRSPRSRRKLKVWLDPQTIMRLHCLSAFTAFPTSFGLRCLVARFSSLHCLSAFTAFPTQIHEGDTVEVVGSLHCLSAFTAFPT